MTYQIIAPTAPKVPIVISVPHCGVAFPDDIKSQYVPELIAQPDDTDWFVDRLYDFAPALGITVIKAHYSRWVIDLNRNPESKPLYNDGRVITALTPTTNFLGESLYIGATPDPAEVQRRLEAYYLPYHQKVNDLLDDLQKDFPHVLLYDAHSIRQVVKTIHSNPFPDLLLGSNDEKSAHAALIKVSLEGLAAGDYSLEHNTLFKGGHITRSFGQPSRKRHALQLERSKTLYMNDAETEYAPKRAEKLKEILKPMFNQLITALGNLD
ncbi:N-formylglutamate amidohydrolase [Microscilla marina]|uniref:N-formylglutamate deformylase n=1 Tax=Microscilla marina ATCC 23134 TaxID=313606 RepID=A1ZN62_MICM2|nr:N-formylglutamate amidohydrolase [Microscilla marina]EAY28243.1 N-formylglutamate deformylase [Microscilla marina ATCC 23134]